MRKNQNIGQKLKVGKKIKLLVNNWNFGPKLKPDFFAWSKTWISSEAKIRILENVKSGTPQSSDNYIIIISCQIRPLYHKK